MIYLISRSICPGPKAGFISLAGVATGFVLHAVRRLRHYRPAVRVPLAYDLRFSGAAYLLYLAWQAVKPGGCLSRCATCRCSNRKLFSWAVHQPAQPCGLMYLALMPQFIDRTAPASGSRWDGRGADPVSITVNSAVTLAAGSIAGFLGSRPSWLLIQRWLMGTVLAGLAVRIALQAKK